MYDVLIIGGGVIGSMIARRLSRYTLKTVVLEKEDDVGEETSSANSAIVHSGYDPKPGTLKAKLNVEGNAMFDDIARELDVQFERIGSITLANTDEEVEVLKDLAKRSEANGVPYKILNHDELKEIEPNITDQVKQGLLCPTAGIVNPFELTVAGFENAMDNGVELFLNQTVKSIKRVGDHFVVTTQDKEYETKYVINAAGTHADEINDMVNEPFFRIKPRKGEYMVLDHFDNSYCRHTLFNVPSSKGKGVLISPTTHHNYLIGPSSEFVDDREDVSTDAETIKNVKEQARRLFDSINYREQIRTFAGDRAYAEDLNGKGMDFIIEETTPHFINVAGIQSPGLASSPAIARMVVDMIEDKVEKKDYNPTRRPTIRLKEKDLDTKVALVKENPKLGKIVCRCETVSEGEIIDCIHRNCGARTIKGVKRRVRPGMGKCQGGFCQVEVGKILARELNENVMDVMYGKTGSYILKENLNKEGK
jgi:glycerol-3-phosphate dehydrogenase